MKYRMFGRGAMWGRGCSRNTCAPVTVEEAAAVVAWGLQYRPRSRPPEAMLT